MRDAASDCLESLRQEVREARRRIVDLIVRAEHIRLQLIPQIEADYAVRIGCWERAAMDAELEGRRAKRRLALARAQANQGSRPRLDEIECQLDEEFAGWLESIREARLSYANAIASYVGSIPLPPDESSDLKELYRSLVWRLHPDVRGGEEVSPLFAIAQSAYRRGDVHALRSLEVATRGFDAGLDDLDGVEDDALLGQELELALIEEGVMRERLDGLLASYELALGRLLEDDGWVSSEVNELQGTIEMWNGVRDECSRLLDDLMRRFDG